MFGHLNYISTGQIIISEATHPAAAGLSGVIWIHQVVEVCILKNMPNFFSPPQRHTAFSLLKFCNYTFVILKPARSQTSLS